MSVTVEAIGLLQFIHTDDKGNHRGPVPPCSLEALDQLLHLPYLNVLLRLVRLSGAHVERRDEVDSPKEGTASRVNLTQGNAAPRCERWESCRCYGEGSKILARSQCVGRKFATVMASALRRSGNKVPNRASA